MQFSYKAQEGKTGGITTGVIEASSRYTAAEELRKKGLTPIAIEEGAGQHKKGILSFSFSFKRVPLHEKILFTKNIAGMLSAGLSLSRALTVLARQTKNVYFKTIIDSLVATIDKGGTLSDGMNKYPDVFSTLFVAMVRAGQESGSLSKSLAEVGSHLEKSYALQRKIKGALMYPSIIVLAIIIIAVLMLIFVVPTLTSVFKEMGVVLPASTRFVIWISDLFSAHPIIVFVIIALCAIGIGMVSRVRKVQRLYDIIVIHAPVFGLITQEVNAARTARTLASLLSSGVDVTRALSITRDVLQNHKYKEVVAEAEESVQKGVALSVAFKKHIELYPIMMGEMMEVGEETGNITQMLIDVANFYEGEVDAKTKDLSTIIEPILMVFIGGAVGFFAVSMITPMYSLVNVI